MMKKLVFILCVLGFAGESWGQELPQYRVITEAKIEGDTLYVKGFEKSSGKFTKKKRNVGISDVYTNKIIKWFPTVSLLTVPFKIRPKIEEQSANAFSDLKNVGVNIDFGSKQWDRYFTTGKISTHRASFGILIAPLTEELTEKNTKNKISASKQLFASCGLSLNYSYNKLTFTAIPLGFDFATNSEGKQWVYNRKYWWGFGVGVDLKILEGVFNK